MTIRLHPKARDEAAAASEWYERQREGLGADFEQSLEAAFATLGAAPLRPAPWKEGVSGREYRRVRLVGFPYSIIYEVRGAEVHVLAVAHARRDPGYWGGRQT